MTKGLPFRSWPDVGPAGKVSIRGPARCGAARMKEYAARRNPNAPDTAELYVAVAERYGVRGDVAYCQAMYDTRTWTLPAAFPPWRPVAQRIWRDGAGMAWARELLEEAVQLHIQFLHAFASSEYPAEAPPLPEYYREALQRAGLLGTVKNWEDLNGKWVVPGARYGQDILAIWRNMMAWKAEKWEGLTNKQV